MLEGKINSDHAGTTINLLATLEPPPKTLEISKNPLKEPQDQSGSLELLSRSGTAENTTKANIQGVEIHLVKINKKG